MLDAQNAVAAAPAAIRREDYRPPEWLVPEISLDFDLGAGEDDRSRDARRSCATARTDAPLRLDGDGDRACCRSRSTAPTSRMARWRTAIS